MERYLHQSIDTETERGERTFSDIFPLGISQIPTLLYISELQYAITAKVLSAIATRPIVTVFDVERELCDEYDVKQFRDFGIADALHHLPIVQLYFKVEKDTDVLPVTGSEVMDYVLLNDEAAGILQSNGDSIDIAYHFCRFYADKTNQPYHRVRLNRLGLHIQNLTKFLHHMRAEIAESGQCIHRLIHSQKLRASKNAVLYTRLLSALDAQLSCRPPVAGDDLEFAVGMTREEAQCTTLPMSVFCPANAPVGGVEIRLCVKSPNQTTTESAVRLSSTNTGVGGTAQLGGGNTHGRRNKTYVDTTSTPVASGSATADVLSFLQPKGLTTTPIVKSIPTLETTVETVSEPSHPIVPNADPGQVLEQFLQDDQGLVAETYWRAVDALSALQVGRRVSLELLRGVFRKLSRFISTHSGGGAFLEELRERIRIPVPQVGVTSPSQSGITIAALSPIAGVCWESPSSVDLEECRLLARAQRPMYADLKLFFCEQLGISVLPTTQVWLQFVETLRCGGPPISDGVEKQILNLLCGCVEDDFSERLAHCKVEGPAACKAALTSLLSSLPPDLPLRYMFPLQGRWRRAVDDLYFAGSTYFGLSGTYLESSNGAHKESPLVLHFSGKGPHFAVDAFLSHAGVCAVERCVKKSGALQRGLDADGRDESVPSTGGDGSLRTVVPRRTVPHAVSHFVRLAAASTGRLERGVRLAGVAAKRLALTDRGRLYNGGPS
ncbi:hypothetical protein AGDE_13950 [Angomonas deanei]|uniref:Uncharacterized protein n=1 Tax=Angomonas deanei TaxID=59799 RepID=A0A7G2CJJ0_9TRYP|nr:hypothetical protein AGDE_13950 [Angomonas deanei]CAD2220020.1 hypothetical protein, conserved [Angomonas deanei]|eukprot:EPY21609.1 hypothetical protein AGDE_13950 [Angomonas deanei]